jgi:hypothetical protein
LDVRTLEARAALLRAGEFLDERQTEHGDADGNGRRRRAQPRGLDRVGPGDNTPFRLKLAGGVSLFSWFAVLYFGRMLPFIGNAF